MTPFVFFTKKLKTLYAFLWVHVHYNSVLGA